MNALLRRALRLALPLTMLASLTACVVVPAHPGRGYGYGPRHWDDSPDVVVVPPPRPVLVRPAPWGYDRYDRPRRAYPYDDDRRRGPREPTSPRGGYDRYERDVR